MEKEKTIKRKFQGIVVSDKMDKTVVVRVDFLKTHPLYKKKIKASRKFKANDEKNQYKTGDFVEIIECRPLSKDKRWYVGRRIKKAYDSA